MSDQIEDAAEPGRGDGEEPGRGDGEARTSQRASSAEAAALAAKAGSAASQSSTGGRGDADKTEQEPLLASQENVAGSAQAYESSSAQWQAAPAEDPKQPAAAPTEPQASVVDRRKTPRGPRPSLSEEREPVFHDEAGYQLRIEPADLAKLRELPGAKGKTDRELGEQFFNGQSARLIASIAGDVAAPAQVRVVVDPYSRQAFLAVGRTIRGIVSF